MIPRAARETNEPVLEHLRTETVSKISEHATQVEDINEAAVDLSDAAPPAQHGIIHEREKVEPPKPAQAVVASAPKRAPKHQLRRKTITSAKKQPPKPTVAITTKFPARPVSPARLPDVLQASLAPQRTEISKSTPAHILESPPQVPTVVSHIETQPEKPSVPTTEQRPDPELDEDTMSVFVKLIAANASKPLHTEETLSAPSFSEFLAEETLAHKPLPNLESIQTVAPQQPLEVTFVQLGTYLHEAPETDVEAASIRELVAEIFEEIEDCLADVQPGEIIALTPELTQKLIVLLETIGYQNAGEVLVDCITNNDIAFLLDGLRYLAEPKKLDKRPETAALHTIFATQDDNDSLSARLGKMIIRFVRQTPIAIAPI